MHKRKLELYMEDIVIGWMLTVITFALGVFGAR